MSAVTFKPVGDANGVLLPLSDATVYVTPKGYTTSDLVEIAFLDENEFVERSKAQPATPAPAPAAPEVAPATDTEGAAS